jgi:hypothetical protein
MHIPSTYTPCLGLHHCIRMREAEGGGGCHVLGGRGVGTWVGGVTVRQKSTFVHFIGSPLQQFRLY